MASDLASDESYQRHILQGVSRTFALTIPELPSPLRTVVGNAYLLCRIADTIEDEARLPAEQKRYFWREFARVVAGDAAVSRFSDELSGILSSDTPEAERDLVRNAPRIIRLAQSFSTRQQRALNRCVQVMGDGMWQFQRHKSVRGLPDVSHLDGYCYFVAGIVGEMLTELFCDYSAEIDSHGETLRELGVSFGQGLQMTNILKDMWEDHQRGACWLPRDLFGSRGIELEHYLAAGGQRDGFESGLRRLIGIARYHLHNGLRYTLLVPSSERGIRCFCLLALGMAVLTLRKIHSNLDFSSGREVKISRASVKATILVAHTLARRDRLLGLLFATLTRAWPTSAQYSWAVPKLHSLFQP
jgi:farnesyl-diphosphate farnesyltransferase